jgi:hypothetical protein
MTGPAGDMGDTYLSDIGGSLLSGTEVRGDQHRAKNATGGISIEDIL